MTELRPLADDLFRIAHEDYTGKCRLSQRTAATALAAGLLAELIATQHTAIADDKVILTHADKPPPPDALAHAVLDQLVAEKREHHPVRTWLQFFSRDSTSRVAQRLERRGDVRAITVGKLRKHTVWLPTDPNDFAGPTAVIETGLRRLTPLAPHWQWLAGLCFACGLHQRMLVDAQPASTEYLRHLIGGLYEPMRLLLHHTEAVIAGSVLTPTV